MDEALEGAIELILAMGPLHLIGIMFLFFMVLEGAWSVVGGFIALGIILFLALVGIFKIDFFLENRKELKSRRILLVDWKEYKEEVRDIGGLRND